MNNSHYQNMTREDAIAHCKKYAEIIRQEGVDRLVEDYEFSVGLGDEIDYPLDCQEWITPVNEPILYAISVYAVRVDNDHTDREAWEKILQLTDILD